ncbi:putative ribonuclease H-like domain-containing protein [Tanacetum coccineum]
MSEADPIPPTSSVTALRIPMIKKGEYDLWSMKMRYTKNSLACHARRNNEKALNILLFAIPDRHLLSFHDATDAKTLLWSAIKARFGGNEASKSIMSIELKGVSNSSSQNIAFLSTEVKGSTLKQSTAGPANIPKGYTQAPSSKVAMITARIRKFMRKTGRPIDLKPKNGITFDKANGRNEKKIVAIEDSNSKALVATDNNEEVDWTKEFDDEPVTFAMMALTELEEVIGAWSYAESVHFGQDGLGDFDWSNKADDTPVSLALMATNSEVLNSQTSVGQGSREKELGTKEVPSPKRGLFIPSAVTYKGKGFEKYCQTKNGHETVPSKISTANVFYQGDKDKLSDFKEFKGGYVAFGNDPKGGRITGKGTIKTSCIDFEKVSYVEELKFNLLIYSQILTCLVAKATKDEAVLWHRRLGHVNFKNINKLVQGNLVRGLPSKTFKLDHSCLACRKGKQHRASCKKIEEREKGGTVREPLELLHMDLFGPVSVESVNRKKYCLVVTDDYSKFSWVCDHGTEFKNHLMNEFCAKKGIKRQYSIARTPQQNGVAEERNRISLKLLEIYQLGKFDGKSEEGYLLGYSTSSKGFRVYNRVTRKVQDCLHVDFLEISENQKAKHLCSPNSIRRKVPADKEVPLSTEEQALHDELVSLMHQESIAKVHTDAQRNTFEEAKRRIALAKGKEIANSTLTLSTANTPSQSTGNTPTDSDDDVPKDGVFSTNSFDAENTDNEEDGVPDYNNMDHTIDVNSTPTLRIHKNHPQSQIIGKSTDGVLTRRKLKESASDQHQALLIEAIRTLLAFASFMGFTVYQMDVKSAFLYGNITEEVYVKQPPGFEDPAHPNKVYRVVKALYGLYSSLLKSCISCGTVYVDDIIFGSTKSSMVKDFEDLMQKEFKMSSMGELTFFLGLQVKQTTAGSKSLQGFSLHAVKRIFSDYAGDNHDSSINFREGWSISWKIDWSLGNARKQNNCGYIISKAEYVSSCKLLLLWYFGLQNQDCCYGI